MAGVQKHIFSAKYAAPGGSHESRHEVDVNTRPANTKDQTQSLASLGTKVSQMQREVNAFLTDKMEDDRRAAGAVPAKDEASAEDNYGEEVDDS